MVFSVRYRGIKATRQDVEDVALDVKPEEIGGCQRGIIGIYKQGGEFVLGYSVLAWFNAQKGIAGEILTARDPRILDEKSAKKKLKGKVLELMLELDKNANIPIKVGRPGSLTDPEEYKVVTIEQYLISDGGFLELKKRRAKFKDYKDAIKEMKHG
jgi:hypothetical protein